MLKEKVFFRDGLPVNAFAAEIEEYPIHFHDEMEIVYVLAGSVILKNGYYTYTLQEGDVFILNDREIHSFYQEKEHNMIAFYQISLEYFSAFFDQLKNNFFVADMKNKDNEQLEGLRMKLLQMLAEVLKQEKGYEEKIIAYTIDIITLLREDFLYFALEDGKFINDMENKSNKGNKVLAERLRRITNYMYENHARKLTLTEIANNEHLNVYYLSHVIRESAGVNFQELLNFIRVEESEMLLLGTDKKISMVAAESGFSAVRYYIKYFKKWFGVHPAQYRTQYTARVNSLEFPARYNTAGYAEISETVRNKMPDAYMQYFGGKDFYRKLVSICLGEISADGQVYSLSLDLRSKNSQDQVCPQLLVEQVKALGQELISAIKASDWHETHS